MNLTTWSDSEWEAPEETLPQTLPDNIRKYIYYNICELINEFLANSPKCTIYTISYEGKPYGASRSTYKDIAIENVKYINKHMKRSATIKRGDIVMIGQTNPRYPRPRLYFLDPQIYFFDGNKLIHPSCYDGDSKSGPGIPEQFNCISEFTPAYWNQMPGYDDNYIVRLDLTPYLSEITKNIKIHNDCSEIYWSYFNSPSGVIMLYMDHNDYQGDDPECDDNDEPILPTLSNHVKTQSWYTVYKSGWNRENGKELEKMSFIFSDYHLFAHDNWRSYDYGTYY